MARKKPEFIRYSEKPCVSCDEIFQPKSSVHKFCSDSCKGTYKYKIGGVTTDSQYKEISGNWYRYLQRLTYTKGRENISTRDLLDLIEIQDYKCSLTNQPLTCTLGRGMKFMTNASLDRIRPGENYSKDNIRFVCRIANVMKWNMSDEELKTWCERILNHAKG